MVIQRLQTVYLLLAAILMAVFTFMPVMNVLNDAGEYVLNAVSTGFVGAPTSPCWLLLCMDVLIVALLFITVFKYKNLPLQMKLCKIGVLLIVALLVSIFVMWYMQRGHGIALMSLWTIMPFVAIFLTLLAHKGIKSDKKLLSDSERLR